MKFYDRTKALDAMYELKDKGYKDIILEFNAQGLALACNANKTHEPPVLSVDSVIDWTSRHAPYGDYEYWWIFD